MRKCLIASVLIIAGTSLPGEAKAQTKSGSTAAACLAKPKGVAPAGKWWRYRTDRKNKRRCWYLAAGGKPTSASGKRAAKTRAGKLPSRIGPAAFPPARTATQPVAPPQRATATTPSAKDPLVGRTVPHPSDDRTEFGAVGPAAGLHALPPAPATKPEPPAAGEITASATGTPAPAAALPAPLPAPPRTAESTFATASIAAASPSAEGATKPQQPHALLLLGLLFGSFSIAALSIRGIVRMAR